MYESLRKIFENVGRSFYKDNINIRLSTDDITGKCDEHNTITLPVDLLEKFTQNNLPRFTLFYHELGHALYTQELWFLIHKWEQIPSSINLHYDEKYYHLLNWIEDLYVEQKIIENYPYLEDIISCLKKLKFDYDINAIDKAFNHYYTKGYASPALDINDGLTFKNYIQTLLQFRSQPNFGKGPISFISKYSSTTTFIQTLIDFHKWCVSKGIFPDDYLPPLSSPINTLGNGQGQQSQQVQGQGSDPGQNGNQGNDQGQEPGAGGSITEHTHLVGDIKEIFPDIDASSTEIFVEQFTAENKLIREELANRSRVESCEDSLDGLFNSLFKDTSIIQNRIIVPNFFNPNRLIDQVLFKAPNYSFNNVSIYRDISGSTSNCFDLIDNICKHLMDKIPIATHFYLYASGNISILETQYQPWSDMNDVPPLYQSTPEFRQMGCGTNSGAIADVITQQFNDKWLNIIVTDGDLHDLLRQDNIESLLSNVFVIAVDSNVESDLLKEYQYIFIENEKDIHKIAPKLMMIKEN